MLNVTYKGVKIDSEGVELILTYLLFVFCFASEHHNSVLEPLEYDFALFKDTHKSY